VRACEPVYPLSPCVYAIAHASHGVCAHGVCVYAHVDAHMCSASNLAARVPSLAISRALSRHLSSSPLPPTGTVRARSHGYGAM
jgi:hypothetical protein